MTLDEILSQLKKAFEAEDIERVEELVNEYENEIEDENLGQKALELAVESGCTDYVEEHIEDFDTWDMGYLLDLTEDPSMIEVLNDHGIYHEWEYYDGSRFALETVNGTVLSFDPDFHKEVWVKYMEEHNLSDESVVALLNKLSTGEDLNDEEEELEMVCDLLKVSVSDNGTLQLGEYGWSGEVESECGASGFDLVELLENLGYDIKFVGERWKLETNGVYYIE